MVGALSKPKVWRFVAEPQRLQGVQFLSLFLPGAFVAAGVSAPSSGIPLTRPSARTPEMSASSSSAALLSIRGAKFNACTERRLRRR